MYEKIFTCFCSMFTLMFMSMFISTLTTKMMQLNQIREEHKGCMRLLNRYLDTHKTTWQTAYLARHHLDKAMLNKALLKDEVEILELLPKHILSQVLHEVRMPVLRTLALFAQIDENFKQARVNPAARAICKDAVRVTSAQRTEILFERNEPCKQMLFIQAGSMEYSEYVGIKKHVTRMAQEDSRDGRSLRATLRKSVSNTVITVSSKERSDSLFDESNSFLGQGVEAGGWVSEAALWLEWKHSGSFVAVQDSILLAVEAQLFAGTVVDHPDVLQFVQLYAQCYFSAVVEVEKPTDVMDLKIDLASIIATGPPYPWQVVATASLQDHCSKVSFQAGDACLDDNICHDDIVLRTSDIEPPTLRSNECEPAPDVNGTQMPI